MKIFRALSAALAAGGLADAAAPLQARLAKNKVFLAFKATLGARADADARVATAPAPAPAAKGHATVDHLARGGEVTYPPKSHLPNSIDKKVRHAGAVIRSLFIYNFSSHAPYAGSHPSCRTH
jgi:hypothetical protein